MEDATLDFFNEMFDTIPKQYRQIDAEMYDDKPIKAQKNRGKRDREHNKSKGPKSMLEMTMIAKQKIADIQKNNRDKSMAKIAQLTIMHEKEGRIKKPKYDKNNKKDETMFDDLKDDKEDGEAEENKTNNKRSKPHKEYINKGKVADDKAANKRRTKEAKKQSKLNK